MFRHLAGCLLFFACSSILSAQCPITVSAGEDIVRCTAPSSVQLSGNITGSYLGFTWSPTTGMSNSSSLNPTVNVSQTTNYILTATALDASINLINNGDFEQGVTGFTSDYIYSPGDLYAEGVYDVLTNPSSAHPDFPACSDHTTGSGNMLAVNGAGNAGADIWCQTVTVSPNTQYVFTAWATALVPGSPARLQFSINGVNLGSIFNVSSQTCNWQNFYAIWNSGNTTSATICIVNQNTAQSGNDFAVDDIVFSPVCKVSDTVRVEVVNLKAMATTTTVTLPCQGASATLSGAGSSVGPGIMYEWQTLDGNIVSGGNTLSPVINSPGSYTLRVSFETASGVICEKFVTVNVFYTTNPLTAIIVPPAQLGCSNATVTLVGNATPSLANVTYQWTVISNGHIVGSTTSKNCVVNQPGTYQLMVTNSVTGCTSTAQMAVTAEANLPSAQASSDTINCVKPTAALSGIGSSTGAGINYHWSTANGVIVSGQDSQNAVAGQIGTYVLSVTNSATGCVVRDTVTVIEDKVLPHAVINPPQSIDCDSDTIGLFVNLYPPPFVLLIWTASDGGNIASGQYTPNPMITSAGTYILHTADPLNGCISIDTVAVISNFVPPTAATLPADTLSCQIKSVALSGTGSSVGFNYGYQWSTTGGNIESGDQTLAPVVNTPGTYTLTVLDYINGCTAVSNVLVAADTNAVSAVTHAMDTLSCAVFTIPLSAAGSSTGPNITYFWDTTEGMIINGADTPTPMVSAPGWYDLTITNTSNGCFASDSVLVLQDTMPPMTLLSVPNQITCANPIQTITANPFDPSGSYAYSWTASSGGNILPPNDASVVSVNAPGTYVLQLSNVVNGCTAMYSVSVTQEAGIPIVETAVSGLITCADTTLTLSSAGSSAGIEYQYAWSASNGGNILSGNTGPAPLINAAGTYYLQIVNTSNGCSASDSLVVLSNTTAPAAVAGLGSVLTCAQPVATLIANENLPNTNLAFQWSSPAGHFLTDPNQAQTECDVSDTYFLLVTDTINGCISIDSLEITENTAPPMLFVAPPMPLTCATITVNLSATASGSSAALPLFHWQTGNGNFVSGDSTANPQVNMPGNYALTVTDPANGCTKSGGAIVFQNINPPPIQVLPANPITCATPLQILQGQNMATGGNFAYLWSAATGGHITSGDSTLQATADAAGMYLLTATNLSNGCTSTDSIALLQNTTPPLADAGISDTLNCLNNSLTIQGSASGQGTLTYLWTAPVNGNITTGASSLTPTVNLPGSYVFEVTDLANGCKSTDSVAVFQDANIPMADAGEPLTLNCVTTQQSLQGTASTGNNYSYIWSTADGNILSGATTLSPVVDAPGTYLLAVMNSANGCVRQDSVLMEENLTPPALMLSIPGLLTCSTVSLSLSAQTPVPGGTFVWTTPDGFIVSGNMTPNPTVNQPGTYINTVTDPSNGCISTDSILVSSDTAAPVLVVDNPDSLTCAVTQIALSGTITQPTTNFSVHWTTSGGSIDSGQNSTNPLISAAGTYQMNVLNQQNGCNAFVSIMVAEDVQPPTAMAASNQQLTCDSTTVTLSGTGSSMGSNFTYLWSGPDIVGGPATTAPVVAATGPYTLLVTNIQNGCTATATATVTADQTPPLIAIASPLPLTCVRNTVQMDATASSNGPGFQANWTTTGSGHFVSGQNTWMPLTDAPGPYTLTLENTNNGCTATQTVSVLQNIAAPGASIAPPPEFNCNEQEVVLTGTSPTANAAFAWSTAVGQIVSGAATAVPTIAAPGIYQLLVTNPSNGCTSAAQTLVDETLPPDFLPIVWQPDCHNNTGAVDFGPVSAGKSPFEYSIDGGQTYHTATSFEQLAPGVYELVVRDDYGCSAVAMRTVETPFLPQVMLGGIQTLELGDSIQLLPTLNLPPNNIVSWEWSPSLGLSCSDCAEPIARPLESVTYSLTIEDLNGCIAEARTQFRVIRNRVLYPPNIISPNGDGKNDFFNLFGKGVLDIQWMRIYDRWGNQLYAGEHVPINEEMQGWNGMFRGQPVNPGVFVWQAKVQFIDGVAEIFSGDVSVIR